MTGPKVPTEGKRSLLSLPVTPETVVIQLICTGGPHHDKRHSTTGTQDAVRVVGLISSAPDGRQTIIHDVAGNARTYPTSVQVSAGMADDGTPVVRDVLDSKCPLCGRHFQRRKEWLKTLLDKIGVAGRVVVFDLSMVE